MRKKYTFIDSEQEIKSSYKNDKSRKRERLRLTDYQQERLEEYFVHNVYPDRYEKMAIGEVLKIPLKNINIWFQNRRARERAFMEEQEDKNQ